MLSHLESMIISRRISFSHFSSFNCFFIYLMVGFNKEHHYSTKYDQVPEIFEKSIGPPFFDVIILSEKKTLNNYKCIKKISN